VSRRRDTVAKPAHVFKWARPNLQRPRATLVDLVVQANGRYAEARSDSLAGVRAERRAVALPTESDRPLTAIRQLYRDRA
jgi:hypothetical protein